MTIGRLLGIASARLGLALAALVAVTVPPPDNPTPVQCLNAFDSSSADVDYVGDGWPGALVSGPPSPWLYSLFGDRDFSLYCGDELSGVIHIGSQDSTGTGHPITEADQDYFVGCWTIVIGLGDATDLGNGRTRFELVVGSNRSVA